MLFCTEAQMRLCPHVSYAGEGKLFPTSTFCKAWQTRPVTTTAHSYLLSLAFRYNSLIIHVTLVS